MKTGRPVERTEAHWTKRPAIVAPAVFGAHNWHPMSFHPGTGLVYVPAIEFLYRYVPDPDFRFTPGRFNTAEDLTAVAALAEGFEELNLATCSPTRLLAWDPVAQRKVWEVKHATGVPGGVLSTAGGLVFQGSGTGVFAAYDARNGDRLWSSDVGIGIMAGPVTYTADGAQYVAVLAGIGGSQGGHLARFDYENDGRVLAWKLGGKAPMPPVKMRPAPRVEAPALDVDPETVVRGRRLYTEHCGRCHGIGAKASGLYPDLRHASRDSHARWNDIVLGGTRVAGGMASFADVISAEEAQTIHAYVIERARHEPGALERLAAWFAESPLCVPPSWLTD
jgi:mono/diheme cytochrome c family protein